MDAFERAKCFLKDTISVVLDAHRSHPFTRYYELRGAKSGLPWHQSSVIPSAVRSGAVWGSSGSATVISTGAAHGKSSSAVAEGSSVRHSHGTFLCIV